MSETPSNPSNPLLAFDGPPLSEPIRFEQIRADHVQEAVDARLASAQAAIADLSSAGAARSRLTYDAVLGGLERATEPLEITMTLVGHLESVSSSPALRDVYNAVQPEVSAFYASIPLDDGLYRTLKAYAETDEAKALTGPRRRHLEKTLDEFRRHGAELPPDKKTRLTEISRELAELTSKFAQNVVDATAAYELVIEDESKLKGLPESALAFARQSARDKGVSGWRLTLHAPSYVPAMTYLDDASIREELYRAYNTRASTEPRDNPALIVRILELRSEQASLLGYRHFADFVLEPRMAKTGAEAVDFVARLRARCEEGFKGENEALSAFRSSIEGSEAPGLQPWDIGYYAEKQRQSAFDFDEEALRPYFPLDGVMKGLFATAERLFGVVVRRVDLPVWHEEVLAYEVADTDGTILGAFYADLHPRDAKRGGAWMNPLMTAFPGTERGPHLGLMCGNLARPVDGRPALLSHQEVSTLFHEFGHLLHHLLSRVSVRSLAGTNVAWDFVELPSQIMENWCWEREALDLFARHYETQAPIPEDLFQKMVRARTFRAANAMMRQLGFADLDLTLHTSPPPPTAKALLERSRDIMAPYAPAPHFEGFAFVAGFGHLFSSAVGYAAGYYSYKWAEVLDADAFTRFRAEGVFSPEVGRAFRDAILANGDAEDPLALYERFMGRAPDPEALFLRAGLSKAA